MKVHAWLASSSSVPDPHWSLCTTIKRSCLIFVQLTNVHFLFLKWNTTTTTHIHTAETERTTAGGADAAEESNMSSTQDRCGSYCPAMSERHNGNMLSIPPRSTLRQEHKMLLFKWFNRPAAAENGLLSDGQTSTPSFTVTGNGESDA